MADDALRTKVEQELLWEPRLQSQAVAVSADDGVVTLRGTVGTLREKLEARNAAKRVHGVRDVDDELQVRLLGATGRDDAELLGAVLQALMLNALVPASVDATAHEGVVTLTGTAAHQFEREEAEFVAGNVRGDPTVSRHRRRQARDRESPRAKRQPRRRRSLGRDRRRHRHAAWERGHMGRPRGRSGRGVGRAGRVGGG